MYSGAVLRLRCTSATLFELVRRGRYKMTHVTREESSFAGLRHKAVDERLSEPRGLLQ